MPEKKTILVIDDDKGVRELLKEFLKLYGFEAYSIDSGISALNLLKNKYFDIIITDYSMPEMNGIELTRLIKAQYPNVSIIGMSGNCEGLDFLEAGADAFLSKPPQLHELLCLCCSK
jgi:CheY-like chemotaxis protein